MIERHFGKKEEGISYKVRPGVYGICIKGGKLAVVKSPGGFFLPGGGIEEGEDHRECLMREFEEETGYTIHMGEFLGIASLIGLTPSSKKYLELQGHFYLVDLLELTDKKVEEDHEFIWMDLEGAIEGLRLDNQRYAAEEAIKIKKGIKEREI